MNWRGKVEVIIYYDIYEDFSDYFFWNILYKSCVIFFHPDRKKCLHY